MWDQGFCINSLTYYPIDAIIPGMPNDIGVLMVVTGLTNVIMSLVTIGWIKKNEHEAQAEGGREEAAKSVIFPVFVQVLWLSIFSNLLAGLVVTFVPLNPVGGNSVVSSLAYSLVTACRHAVNEGIAIMLMQKGCGFHAAKKAASYACLWGIITFGLMYYIYAKVSVLSAVLEVVWDLCLLAFYGVLWLAPLDKVFTIHIHTHTHS
ncbi:hypothetical protein EON65_47920 [archaeon]|nr:MAG: hypothetical protein EON65_47920 [archaeon]